MSYAFSLLLIIALSSHFKSKYQKSENSSYISKSYYNTCNLLTIKEIKMQKLQEREGEGKRAVRGSQREKIGK